LHAAAKPSDRHVQLLADSFYRSHNIASSPVCSLLSH
jgi:hypothetical protein